MPGNNIFVAESTKEMGICLLCERICICIIRTPCPCPELSIFHFMVQQRLAPLQRYLVLVFQQKQYLLLLPSRQTVYCGHVFDQQHTKHLPLQGGKHIVIWGHSKKKFKRAVWRLLRVLLQLPGSHLCPCFSLAHLKT